MRSEDSVFGRFLTNASRPFEYSTRTPPSHSSDLNLISYWPEVRCPSRILALGVTGPSGLAFCEAAFEAEHASRDLRPQPVEASLPRDKARQPVRHQRRLQRRQSSFEWMLAVTFIKLVGGRRLGWKGSTGI